VLIQGAAEEEGFSQGHTRGNHVTIIEGALVPGIHQVKVVHATPNRLYCKPLDAIDASPSAVLKNRSLRVLQPNALQ
jgi:tRNA-2-methylthio-N6-dimethylallyladenosine synthase